MQPSDNNVSGSRFPMVLTLIILGALVITAIVMITPEKNTPMITGDQQAAPLTPTPNLEAGAGAVEGRHNDNRGIPERNPTNVDENGGGGGI